MVILLISTVLASLKRQAICVGGRSKTARHLSWRNHDCRSQIGRVEDHERAPRVSSTTSQAGETDQTTRIDSTEHPESCQLACLARNLRRRKAHHDLYSTLKQHMSQLQAKRPKEPNQHRTIFQTQQRSVMSKDTM